MSLFFPPLCCLSFIHLQILITPVDIFKLFNMNILPSAKIIDIDDVHKGNKVHSFVRNRGSVIEASHHFSFPCLNLIFQKENLSTITLIINNVVLGPLINVRETEGEIKKMDNPETLATLGTQRHRSRLKDEQHGPTKNVGGKPRCSRMGIGSCLA